MKLQETGEARLRGYLYVLGRSLRSFLPAAVVADALRELESHLRERIQQVSPEPDERQALERVLDELGEPLRVAQAYAAELTLEEAVATGGLAATGRALWQLATTHVAGFLAGLGLLGGYLVGLGLLAVAAAKFVLPANTGLILVDGVPRAFGVYTPLTEGVEVVGGYWVILVGLVLGLAALVVTHRVARRLLVWWRARARAWRPWRSAA